MFGKKNNKKFKTPKEAAKYLGYKNSSRIYQKIQSGELTLYKDGRGQYYVLTSELDDINIIQEVV